MGRASTKAVVVSCIMILFADYILSAIAITCIIKLTYMIEVKNIKKTLATKP